MMSCGPRAPTRLECVHLGEGSFDYVVLRYAKPPSAQDDIPLCRIGVSVENEAQGLIFFPIRKELNHVF